MSNSAAVTDIFTPSSSSWAHSPGCDSPEDSKVHDQLHRVFSGESPPRSLSESRQVQLQVEQGPYIQLDAAPGPRALFEGLLHAMLGHWSLFKRGWLHRDVTFSNVLLLRQRVACPAFTDFEATKNITSCVGVLASGGDRAVNWKLDQRELAKHRSGTLPFTSRQLLFAWGLGEPAVHTAIDDVESFLWVLIWALLVSIRRRGELTNCEQYWLASMTPRFMGDSSRTSILQNMPWVFASGWGASRLILCFRTVIEKWGDLLGPAHLEIVELVDSKPGEAVPLDRYYALCEEYYQKYIEAGLAELSKLPETWEEVSL
ncbi:hypothetical protein BJ138DRAFT_1154464 [Hygrophoropsis aurantiaca]|uniref:Uncharacterized protein n=1 Tax=Hygrophoropsis aurantiaca TaxID=72124 RepID=A0ACB8A9P8_9AGAM|nr:hypothetical protein BJ138DRAFT_1154464 [Hygrophoropsis aurantiaca]